VIALPFDFTPATAAFMAAALFIASFVRGYSGFGFAALSIAAAGLVTSPMNMVPVVLLSELVVAAQLVSGAWRQVEWRRALTLFAGAIIGVPLGVWALASVGVDVARAVISIYIIVMCAVLMAGFRLTRPAGDASHAVIGVVSGLANGAAVGGLPVAAFFAAQPIAATAFRATLIAYFALLDFWSIPMLWINGLVNRDVIIVTLVSLPILVIGTALGSRHFLRAEPENFRRFAILLLVALALMGLAKSLL